ncbi:MAG: hypothetical protein HY424_03405 [Candidatus Levybacteria bacterium]|nr:hypothetical protein [Candidatus Levybacteria bacterium]
MTDLFVSPKPKKDNMLFSTDPLHMNVFSSFCRNPKGVTFQTQKQHEIIILFLRAHFITNLSWIVLSLIFLLLPLIVLIFLPRLGVDFLSSAQTVRFTLVYVLFYYLIIFSYIFISFLQWFYNVFIVTSERVVDIDYSDIVVHNIAVTNLSHLEDVNYTQSGFIPTFFNYGNLFVQTAGNERNFEAYSIPKPREATHIIGDLIEKGAG